MFKVHDAVRRIGDNRVGTIKNIVGDTVLIQYSDGTAKLKSSMIVKVQTYEIILTPEKFDEAVKALMYEVAMDIGDDDRLDGALEVIGRVCSGLKEKLFEGN